MRYREWLTLVDFVFDWFVRCTRYKQIALRTMNINVKADLWMNSPEFKVLSFEARAVWFEMVKIMTVATPYGHLKVGQNYLSATALASIVGMEKEKCVDVLDEIVSSGLCERNEDKSQIMCGVLIRHETIRRKRAAGGRKGGNPSLMRNIGEPVGVSG